MISKLSLALVVAVCIWSTTAVPLEPQEPKPNPPHPGPLKEGPPAPKPGEPLPPTELAPKRPVREITPEDPLHATYPAQLQNRAKADENKDKSQETTTEKRNRRSDDSGSDEDDRRVENVNKEKPEDKKRPARETPQESHNQKVPTTASNPTTEKNRKAREATTTRIPAPLLRESTPTPAKNGERKARETEQNNKSGASPLIAKLSEANKESSSTTTRKP